MNHRHNQHHSLFCESCAYFQEQEHGNGNCHRFPPVFAGEASPKESHHWKFPVVHAHNWCGEHSVALPQQASLTALGDSDEVSKGH